MVEYKLYRNSRLNEAGEEVPDDQPIAVPAGFKVPETMEQMMRRLLRSPEFSRAADADDIDTFEDAEDFEIDDDTFDPHSPYEEVFDPVLGRGITHKEYLDNRAVYEKRYEEAYDRAIKEMQASEALRARAKRGAGVSPAPSSEAPKPVPQPEKVPDPPKDT